MAGETEGGEEIPVEEAVVSRDAPSGDLEHLERPRRVPALRVDPVLAEGGAPPGGLG